jgi:hypothetical protein
MFQKKKTYPEVDRRKDGKNRRRPGDQRFAGRLVGKKKGAKRGSDRRKGDRRKG